MHFCLTFVETHEKYQFIDLEKYRPKLDLKSVVIILSVFDVYILWFGVFHHNEPDHYRVRMPNSSRVKCQQKREKQV